LLAAETEFWLQVFWVEGVLVTRYNRFLPLASLRVGMTNLVELRVRTKELRARS
jgi:hypothetical protein